MGNIQEDIVGTWRSEEPGAPELTFAEDGAVSGTDGCNRIVSRYTVAEDRAVIEAFATTKMACQGVDTWLGAASEAVPDGTELQILNSGGDAIGVLERVE
ncbi:META domain-containing protein [Leucobacter allii]|uniref:META domain-containing protein n=1 Tax=Leucobacter allii TaxID=2932247 RepID=UPI001FD58D22|nr:META domain-containing protein [Leucobacter allii]UOR01038.1 META domain-containing protein [Leucobacter allii]